jgi:hypothetical protein
MPLELLTQKDLQEFKAQLFEELKKILAAYEASQNGNLLKSKDVCRKLMMSPGKLQTMRKNKMISYGKIGGTIYYENQEIIRLYKEKKNLKM